ncbi:MAG: anti-sigma factor [Nitrospirae bacterium]|nr:anti-sigma factor [Nitrospirota bacterium]MCL5423285.1 anti-sigma factor [Nitrospirota bacterium]
MDCKDIREKFSAYIDDVLSTQEKMVIDEHLKSCPECAEALADLKKTVEHVKGIETVEPPVWMKQKIMAKVRAEAQPRKGLFQRLFYPLHIKLPVGAIATIAIALTTLYIFRTIEPGIKLAKAPTEEVAPQISQKGQQPALRGAEDKGVTPPVLPLSKGRSEEGLSLEESKGGFSGKAAPAPERPAAQPSISKEMDMKADKLAPSTVQEARKKEVHVPAPAKTFEQAPATGALAKGEARQEPTAAGPGAKLSYMEKKKEEPLILTVFVKDPEAAGKEIEKTLKELEGKVVQVESSDGKKVVSAVLKTSRLHKLSEKLKVIGEIKEKELDVKEQERDVRVRIELTKNP